MDLFERKKSAKEPLAARMRPRNLDEFIGQDHIVGKGRLLRRAIAADQLTSVIFYGPPGTGKTTLARVIANHTKSSFITLNAVLTGVQGIRDSIAQAEEQYRLYDRRTILFVDEVHRWNKAQQDALLPWVENGTIILVGATTENPFFEVNKALVSRSRVFQLKPLEKADLEQAARMALSDAERGYGKWQVSFETGALEHLVETANGDARSLLNALELAVETTPELWPPPDAEKIFISQETAEESIQHKVVLYDRDGDYHYDIISAFIKSLRGRDPDAAMYWLARMVAAGEDPDFIFRRMLISACEDTGLADPHAISVVSACAAAFDRIGLPEGRYHLAHAALYLSTGPKSNSSMAFFDALSSVQKEDAEVPNHLRDSSRDAEGFGHGQGYMYPHAYRDHWTAQQYLPDTLVGRVFYTPSSQGYEKTIQNEVLSRREIQIAAILEQQDGISAQQGENLTFSPADKGREHWQRRTEANRAASLLEIRDKLLEGADIVRHSRVLVFHADDGLLLWELLRRTPEGLSCGVCKTEKGRRILEQYAATVPEIERPHLVSVEKADTSESGNPYLLPKGAFGDAIFDAVFVKDPLGANVNLTEFVHQYAEFARSGRQEIRTVFHMAQKIPKKAQRLSSLFTSRAFQNTHVSLNPQSLEAFSKAEELFYADSANPLFGWDENTIQSAFESKGFSVQRSEAVIEDHRLLSVQDTERWFDPENSTYGKHFAKELGTEQLNLIKTRLNDFCAHNQSVLWQTNYVFFRISKQTS